MMESAIRLCYYCPLPLSNFYRGSRYATISTIHHNHTTKFNHATTCASHNFPTLLHPVVATRLFRRVNCVMPDRSSSFAPSNNNNDNREIRGNTILRGLARTCLVLSCVVGLFNFHGKMMMMMMMSTPTLNAAYASNPFPGGEVALQSLLKTIIAQPSEPNKNPIRYSRREPDNNEVEVLKLHVVGLSKSGYQDRALKLLKDECEKFKGSEAEFGLEMALVELLIFQGKYKEACERLDPQIDKFVRDDHTDNGGDGGGSWWHREATVPPKKELSYEDKIDTLLNKSQHNVLLVTQVSQLLLYKAIVQTMLKNKDEAAKWWEAFGQILKENDNWLSPS